MDRTILKQDVAAAYKDACSLYGLRAAVLTGSASLLLQGIDIVPSDIDLLVSEEMIPEVASRNGLKYDTALPYKQLKLELESGVKVELTSMLGNATREATTPIGDAVEFFANGISVLLFNLEVESKFYAKIGDGRKRALIVEHLQNDPALPLRQALTEHE